MKVLKNKYYIRLNEDGKVIKTFSNVYEEATDKDILVGEGEGSQFRVNGNILNVDLQEFANVENGLPLVNDYGFYYLKYEDGLIKKLSDEEIQIEVDSLQKADVTEIVKIWATIDYIAMMAEIDLEV